MSLAIILDRASQLGLKISLKDDKISVVGPVGCVTPELASEIKNHRPELINWLQNVQRGWRSVPPPDVPLNPNRPLMDCKSARAIMEFVVRQIGSDISKGSLCEWCIKKEFQYWQTYQWDDQTCAYAAARDCACWQLQRDEDQAFQIITGCDESMSELIQINKSK